MCLILKKYFIAFLLVSTIAAADFAGSEKIPHRPLRGALPLANNNAFLQYNTVDEIANHDPMNSACIVHNNVGGLGWVVNQFIAPQIDIANDLGSINFMINRRIQHGVEVSQSLLNNLDEANNLGFITDDLNRSLVKGGYFAQIEGKFNSMTINLFPNNTILGIPLVVPFPTEVIVHFSIQQRVSKNIKEISLSSFASGDDLTLKDKINQPYIALMNLLGLDPNVGNNEVNSTPHSMTVITYNDLQN